MTELADAEDEEGLLDLVEVGEDCLKQAAESTERILSLLRQVQSRVENRTIEFERLGQIDEAQQRRVAKQLCSLVSTDLTQFAEGLEREARVFQNTFSRGFDSYAKALSYSEFREAEDPGMFTEFLGLMIGFENLQPTLVMG